MKYQARNSVVPFTNRSVGTSSVTGWEWFFDPGTGLYGSVATTENTDITFPDEVGVTCRVKLVAYGPWTSEVMFEESYMMVENVPAPEIVPVSAISGVAGRAVDVWLDVVDGTGAGQLLFEIVGETYGLSVSSLGHLYGSLLLRTSQTAPITLRVTDALGRAGQVDINLSTNAYGLSNLFDAAMVTVDGSNLLTRWDNTLPGYVASNNYLHPYANHEQITEADGKKAIRLSNTVGQYCLNLVAGTNTNIPANLIVVVGTLRGATATLSQIFGNGSLGLFQRGDSLMYGLSSPLAPAGVEIDGVRRIYAFVGVQGELEHRMVESGVLRRSFPFVNNLSMNVFGGGGGTASANMDVNELIIGQHHASGKLYSSDYDALFKYLGAKYNINTKTYTYTGA